MSWTFGLLTTFPGCCGLGMMGDATRGGDFDYDLEDILLPTIFATTVEGSYYDWVIQEAERLGYFYIKSPTYVNPNSGNVIGMILVFPKNVKIVSQ